MSTFPHLSVTVIPQSDGEDGDKQIIVSIGITTENIITNHNMDTYCICSHKKIKGMNNLACSTPKTDKMHNRSLQNYTC